MIRELSDLGKKLRENKSGEKNVHDALKDEPVSIDLVINIDGSFVKFESIEKIFRPAEAITAKKGKARLLLDKAEEVLCYNGNTKKHNLFLQKLNEYSNLEELKPVVEFYKANRSKGLDKALASFEEQIGEKERGGNIAFRIVNDVCRLHEKEDVYQEIIKKYEDEQCKKLDENPIRCSICSASNYPVEDIPHGMIKRVPDGQTSGCALVSYNDNAYESYSLKGNLNSTICTNCARTYVEGLNWLMSNGVTQIVIDAKGKEKERFIYSNRKNFGLTDTAFIFWTRENIKPSELDLFDEPDPKSIANLIDSVIGGESKKGKYLQTDRFYSCAISGAAARIAVRDWIELSLNDLRKSIARWFQDIGIESWGEDYYPPLYRLVTSVHNEKNKNDTTSSRAAAHLWNASLKGTAPPLWILSAIMKRVRIMENGDEQKKKESITPDRAALIRLILNRNNKGGLMVQEKLDMENKAPAYVCGRIFAVLESVQRAALGKDINAGIRERFFSFASTNPSSAFGRLMKMSQNHLTKLKGEKPGVAVILDKELSDLFSLIDEFPSVFSLEEQGQFAIGYYHQKQDTYKKAKQNRELKAATDEADKEND